MEHLYKAYDMLDRELEELTKQGDVKANTVEMIDELAHGMKSLKTIIAMCESEEGHSGEMYYPHYQNGSYAQRRNSRGQYSRSYQNGSYGRMSRDDSMDMIVKKIDELKQSVDRMG